MELQERTKIEMEIPRNLAKSINDVVQVCGYKNKEHFILEALYIHLASFGQIPVI